MATASNTGQLKLFEEEDGSSEKREEGSTTLLGHIKSINPASQEDGSWVMGHVRDAKTGEAIPFVGTQLPGLEVGKAVRMQGHWEEHPDHGRQFRVEQARARLPRQQATLQRYMAKNIHHCGPRRAEKILDHLGKQALKILAQQPERIREIFDGKVADKLEASLEGWSEEYIQQQQTENASIEIMEVGLSYRMTRRVIEHFDTPEQAREIAHTQPYRLVEVPGIGFQTADEIAQSVGINPHDDARMQAGIDYVLSQAQQNGHTGLSRARLLKKAQQELDVASMEPIRENLERSLRRERLREDRGLIYRPQALQQEKYVAQRLYQLARQQKKLSDQQQQVIEEVVEEEQLTDPQAEALRQALQRGVSILTGRPGSGKTTTTRACVRILGRMNQEVKICAPTGKAASRAEEVTGHQASTIHRLIGGMPGYVRQKPLETDVLIVDEASMVDLEVMAWLLKNIDLGRTRLLLVGDSNQLPSVGHGRVLGDLLDSNVIPKTELTEIFRQAQGSEIVVNAHRLLDNRPLRLDNPPDSDFLFADVTSEKTGPDGFPLPEDPERPEREKQAALQRLENALEYLVEQKGARPARDIQVLSPMRRGKLGVAHLNQKLQQLLNPDGQRGPRIGRDQRVRVGDRVIQTRNDYSVEGGLFNGEQGVVCQVDRENTSMTVEFDDRRIQLKGPQLHNVQLAWAITIHRSQGSEFPYCLLLYHTVHHVMLGVSLFYTAITRAQDLMVVIGNHRALELTRRFGTRHGDRYTRLADRLRQVSQQGG